MLYTDFKGKKLSRLGFGAMRLPLLPDGSVDEATTVEMVRYAMAHGVNYYDTAYPYHGGTSELVLAKALREYPRESWYLADKYPGHQISDTYDPAAVFEHQLKKCGVEYFDFYLLHNVYEKSIDVYLDPKWGMVDYFAEQKRLGRIKHLGFSTHGSVEVMERFIDACGGAMEFCQIQLNWLDWTLQDAKAKVDMLNSRGIPIWVMEPVRGGRLAKLDEADSAVLGTLRPGESDASWGFRFLQGVEGVGMILSGMSAVEHVADNVKTFADERPLDANETAALMDIAERMKDSVPCTGCAYCVEHCPMGLDIPELMKSWNELRFAATMISAMRVEALPGEKQPQSCIGCGSCAAMCPQNIDIPAELAAMAEKMKTAPSWIKICAERAEAARKLAEKG